MGNNNKGLFFMAALLVIVILNPLVSNESGNQENLEIVTESKSVNMNQSTEYSVPQVTWQFSTEVAFLFDESEPTVLGDLRQEFGEPFENMTPFSYRYKGEYRLIQYYLVPPSPSASMDHYRGWVHGNNDSIVSVTTGSDWFAMREIDQYGNDLTIEWYTEEFGELFGLQGDSSDLVVYDSTDWLLASGDQLPDDVVLGPPPSQAIISPWRDGPTIPQAELNSGIQMDSLSIMCI